MTEINYQVLRFCLFSVTGRKELDLSLDLHTRMYCMGTVCLTCEWILGRYNVSADTLAQAYEDALPLPLCSLLLKSKSNK